MKVICCLFFVVFAFSSSLSCKYGLSDSHYRKIWENYYGNSTNRCEYSRMISWLHCVVGCYETQNGYNQCIDVYKNVVEDCGKVEYPVCKPFSDHNPITSVGYENNENSIINVTQPLKDITYYFKSNMTQLPIEIEIYTQDHFRTRDGRYLSLSVVSPELNLPKGLSVEKLGIRGLSRIIPYDRCGILSSYVDKLRVVQVTDNPISVEQDVKIVDISNPLFPCMSYFSLINSSRPSDESSRAENFAFDSFEVFKVEKVENQFAFVTLYLRQRRELRGHAFGVLDISHDEVILIDYITNYFQFDIYVSSDNHIFSHVRGKEDTTVYRFNPSSGRIVQVTEIPDCGQVITNKMNTVALSVTGNSALKIFNISDMKSIKLISFTSLPETYALIDAFDVDESFETFFLLGKVSQSTELVMYNISDLSEPKLLKTYGEFQNISVPRYIDIFQTFVVVIGERSDLVIFRYFLDSSFEFSPYIEEPGTVVSPGGAQVCNGLQLNSGCFPDEFNLMYISGRNHGVQLIDYYGGIVIRGELDMVEWCGKRFEIFVEVKTSQSPLLTVGHEENQKIYVMKDSFYVSIESDTTCPEERKKKKKEKGDNLFGWIANNLSISIPSISAILLFTIFMPFYCVCTCSCLCCCCSFLILLFFSWCAMIRPRKSRGFRSLEEIEEEERIRKRLLDGAAGGGVFDEEHEGYKSYASLVINQESWEIDRKELKILDVIGAGGGGAVIFKAEWRSSNVCVKMFRRKNLFGDSSQDLDAFIMSVIASISHPNILRWFGFILELPKIGIVMEYCEKGDVSECLLGRKIEPLDVRINLIRQISFGMSYLHSRSIIHRDLKPQNVLLDDHLIVKIMDFGLSKKVGINKAATKGNTKNIGTSYFMAPEIVMNSVYSYPVDVFAFSILTFILLTKNTNPYGVGWYGIEFKVANDPNFRPKLSIELENEIKRFGFDWLIRLMKKGWDGNSKDRPTFTYIEKMFLENGRTDLNDEEDDEKSILIIGDSQISD